MWSLWEIAALMAAYWLCAMALVWVPVLVIERRRRGRLPPRV